MPHFDRFVGVDVSKDHLDAHFLPSGQQLRLANTPQGIALLLRHIGSFEGVACGCEATGGYEEALLIALCEAGLPAYCLHPSDIRTFARLKGKRAKTDRLDAKAIVEALAVAAAHRQPVLRTKQQSTIRELITLRRRLIAMLNELKSLKARMTSLETLMAIDALITVHGEARKQAEAAIAAAIARDAHARQTARRIRTVPGAGPVLAAELIGSMPELGHLSSRQAASLTGVAPHPRQSGTRTGTAGVRPGVPTSGGPSIWRPSPSSAAKASRSPPSI